MEWWLEPFGLDRTTVLALRLWRRLLLRTWPYQYGYVDPVWAYGYNDIYEGIFAPYSSSNAFATRATI
jgi:hypothetical protein